MAHMNVEVTLKIVSDDYIKIDYRLKGKSKLVRRGSKVVAEMDLKGSIGVTPITLWAGSDADAPAALERMLAERGLTA